MTSVTFIKNCDLCGAMNRFHDVHGEIQCSGCGAFVKLSLKRSNPDRNQLEDFVKEDRGPRLIL